MSDLEQSRHSLLESRIPRVLAVGVCQEGEGWAFQYNKTTPDSSITYHPVFPLPFKGKCPYGDIGDRIWLREVWRVDDAYDNRPPEKIPEGVVIECATDPSAISTESDGHRKLIYAPGKWRLPADMPRWASRVTLEITNIRIETLRSMTDEEAEREGVNPDPVVYGDCCFVDAFIRLWNSTNKEHLWMSNPWVWVLKFKRI
jgi:hypothetical protein